MELDQDLEKENYLIVDHKLQEPSDMIVRATGQFPYQRDFHDADNVEDGVRSSASNAMHLCM